MCDEIVYHLRSVLDHLACHLLEASGGRVTNTTAWPVERTRWDWLRKVERRQRPWQLWRKKGGGPLKGIPIGSPAWTLVEGAQPYKGGGEARDHPLFGLTELWNANKHRILNPNLTLLIPAGDPLDLFDVLASSPSSAAGSSRRDGKLRTAQRSSWCGSPRINPCPKCE